MQGSSRFDTSALSFQNNYALATEISNMPTQDLTVEFWARTPKYENNNGSTHQEFLSFATHLPGGAMPGCHAGLNSGFPLSHLQVDGCTGVCSPHSRLGIVSQD